jgi:sodium transport system permease protein
MMTNLTRNSVNFSAVLTVWKKELIDHLRDRRTVMMVFMLSVLMGPLLLVGLSFFISNIEEKAEKKEVFILGAANAPQLSNFLARQDFTIKDPKPDFRELIKEGKHDAVLVVPKEFTEKFATGNAEVELVYDDTRQSASAQSIGILRQVMRGFNSEVTSQRLMARGVSPTVTRVVETRNTNLGTPAQRAAALMFIIPWMALFAGISGCTSIAIDLTAGERERGSLEPLLLNPIERLSIVLGKWAAVATYAVAIVSLILAGFALTLVLIPLPKLASLISLSAMQYVSFAALLFPFAPAIGALQMLIATYGRSFKEAQTYVTYLIFVFSFVPVLPMFLQIKDADWQLVVPMMGQLMVLNRVLRGETLGAIHFVVPLIICVIIATVSIYLLNKLLQKENIIFGRS